MSLTLRSNAVYTGQEIATGLKAYQSRVIADGGELTSLDATTNAFLFAKANGISDVNCASATSTYWGIKKSGNNVTKMYSLFGESGDLIVTSGTFALVDSGGVLGVNHIGTSAANMRTFGSSTNPNLGVISAFRSNPTVLSEKAVAGYSLSITSNAAYLRLLESSTTLIGYYKESSATITSNITRLPTIQVAGVVYDGKKAYLLNYDEVLGGAVSSPITVPEGGFTLFSGSYRNADPSAFSGDIFETWGMSGASVETMQKIGARMKGLYQGK